MKTFNKKLIVPFIITLLVTGCMPDSLTKFKKDAPKKSEVVSTTTGSSGPVVDETGTQVPFTPPTLFYMGTVDEGSFSFSSSSGTAITAITAKVDGSVGLVGANRFRLGCSIVTSGDTQTQALPSGLTLDSATCSITGTPTANKSVITPFCSDLVSADQTTCESTLQSWNSVTSTCSNPDFKYRTQDACEAAPNKWYSMGTPVPYRVELRYQNSAGTIFKIYTTMPIGVYIPLTSLKYTQSDKLLLPVTATVANLNAIVPVRTTTAMSGAYLNANLITAQNTAIGIANYVDSTQNLIGVKKLIKMTLTNASAFTVGSFISSSIATGPKLGKIFKKDSSNANTIYVENISSDELYFKVGDQLDPGTTFTSPATASIAFIDDSVTYEVASPALDNDRQYYVSKASLTSAAINSYLVNSANPIKPLQPTISVVQNNGTLFTVAPKLPLGLTIDRLTGVISGKFVRPLAPTLYTVTAKNAFGQVSAPITISASEGPTDLSLTTRQIINVSSTFYFTEGERLFQQIVPPLLDAPSGKILKILNGYQLAIDASRGAFLEGASLDSGNGYFSEKSYIIPDKSCVNSNYLSQDDCESHSFIWSNGPVYFNLTLKLDGPTTGFQTGSCSDPTFITQSTCEELRIWDDANLLCSDPTYLTQATCEASRVWGPTYLTSTPGAKGIIAGIDSVNHLLFIRHVTQSALSVASAKVFMEGDTLVGSARSIAQVDYDAVKLDVTLGTAFTVGKDATSVDAGNGHISAGGYIYGKSSNTLYVSDVTRAPTSTPFKNGDTIYASEFASGSSTIITGVAHDVLIIAERGQKIVLNPSISTSNLIFSITPSLPLGLVLDTKTGRISGTPTAITPKKDFVVTATNFIGQSTYVFSLDVRDYFAILDKSNAPSFVMHKVGDTQIDRKCRVNGTDILNNVGVLDIRCNLEGEEEDLYFNPIKFQALVGPGICEYISYQPYAFWQFSPAQTTNIGTKYPVKFSVVTGCGAGGSAPTTDLCDGNYKNLSDPLDKRPNCDEGKLAYDEITQTGTFPACAVASTVTKTVNCGGKKINCMQGPIKDLLSDTVIASGMRSIIYQSPNGSSQSWTLSTPIGKEDLTNRRVANFASKNLCTQNNADTNTWATTINAAAETAMPFAKLNPYYTFNCLNAASQIKARIRVTVRDWDRDFKINNGIDSLDPSTTVTGVATDSEGAFMDNAGSDLFGYTYNNHNDWDNGSTNYTGAGGSCGVKGAGGTEFAYPGLSL